METIYRFLASLGYTHPLHPAWVSLPMGMVMGALIFALISLLPGKAHLARTARHCAVLALAGIFPTALFGWMDWNHYYAAALILPFKMKMLLAGVLVLALGGHLLIQRLKAPGLPAIVGGYAFCFAIVVAIGWFGGEIVFGRAAAMVPRQGAAQQRTAAYDAIQQVFSDHCVQCHSNETAPLGLRLTSYRKVMAGSQNGPVVSPGRPAESEIVRRIKGIADPRMPPVGPPLSNDRIRTIVEWIQSGAPGPQ